MSIAHRFVPLFALSLSGCAALLEPVALVGYRTEDVEFESAGATLRGTIVYPDDPPVAGVVLIHGSGETPRMRLAARYLAAEGLTVLTYDKRGVGASGGEYEGVVNISATNLDLLAQDAAAAAAALDAHYEGRLPLGYIGISQGGWIGPIAATKAPRVSFIAFCSGPACTVSEELHFSAIAEENADFWKTHTREQVAEHMKSVRYRADDVDPRTALRQLTIPGLWLYGGDDHSIPVDLSIERLDELIAAGHPRFEHRLDSTEGHGASITDLKTCAGWIEHTALDGSASRPMK